MLEWLQANLATVIISALVAVLLGAIVFNMIRNKKKGKSSCSCGCGGCPMSDSCHGKK